ncbi:MAG: M42 family metallopeptidase [Candidatus Carbobacillus altaicus]|uniref:Glutamyl aminopeptidase n=1 Tax=Candidatus Carbonibacillus altaicus TaxID=2163959 RepID=A0A2R6Y5H8_9BACL|nr:M42 family metallopeptidase [Candidatus Carbobacillus altaicus]PTQ57923.1 MAG: Glutamyl aminopeptidase [Candidatus Carbobacillus altaicus]
MDFKQEHVDEALIQTLTESYGAPGFEEPIRKIMERYMADMSPAPKTVRDRLGGLFGVLEGALEGPRVMVAGHMDEVALMVTRITDDGFLHMTPLGGFWDPVLLAQRVVVIGPSGTVPGVIGARPPHGMSEVEKQKALTIDEMFVDVGARSREEVEMLGIRPGDPIVPVGAYTPLIGGRVLAKAWDNRYGVALSLEILRELAPEQEKLPGTLFAGATVQEEVGLRGAETAARLVKPDIFFALDAGPAGDMPGLKDAFGRLGAGVLMRIKDRTMITHPRLRDFLIDLAEQEGIPYQFFISQGGTDAGRVHTLEAGIPSAVIGIPARYIHSHVSIVDLDDYRAAKALLKKVIRTLDRSTLEKLIG